MFIKNGVNNVISDRLKLNHFLAHTHAEDKVGGVTKGRATSLSAKAFTGDQSLQIVLVCFFYLFV